MPDTFLLQAGFSAMLSYDPSLCVLAYCLDSPSTRVKVLVLKVSDVFAKQFSSLMTNIMLSSLQCTVDGDSPAGSRWAQEGYASI